MYLTYDEYEEMGGTMDEDVFDRFEMKARRLIDRATRGRIISETPVRDCVKYCAYELVAAMYADESLAGIAAGRDIAAVSNDGVSVSFATGNAENAATAANARYFAAIRAWLDGETTASGVHLLYAGVGA